MSAPPPPRPPRALERLLGRLIPDGAAGRDSILGDLHQEYLELHRRRGGIAADLWYAIQAVGLAVPWAVGSVRARASEALSGLLLDLRASLRGLRRHPTLVIVGVLSLALGSGLVTAAATVINGAWYASLPWPEEARLVDLEDTHPTEVCRDCSPGTSWRSIQEWRTELGGLFQRIEATDRRRATLRSGDLPMEVLATSMTPGMAGLLALETRVGRAFDDGDVAPGAPGVAILTHGFWERAFGGGPSVIGRDVEVDGSAHTIVGVLAENARPLHRSDLLLPMHPGSMAGGHGDREVWAVARLAEGVTVAAADDALSAVASRIYAEDTALEPGWSARAVPLRRVLARSGAGAGTAFAIVALCLIVLLVAALNLAALLMARVTQRAHELGVRSALGAGRLRVARAAVLDSVVLAAAGGLGGVLMTWLGRDAVVAAFAAQLPPWVSFPIDLRVLAVTVGSVALAALVTGMLPLLRSLAVGGGVGSAAGALRTSRSGRSRAQDLLLGAQIVLGLVLVAGSAGALRTFRTVSDFDRLGHRWEGLTNVMVSVGPIEAESGTGIADLATRIQDALDAHPGIEGHALSRSLFLGSWGTEDAESPVRVSGAREPMRNDRVPRHSMAVGAGYFELNEIPLVAGRGIGSADAAGSASAAVVSEDAARAMWPDRSAREVVGERFTITVGETTRTFGVVGVAAPVIGRAWSESRMTEPRIYTALAQTDDGLYAASPGSGLLMRIDARGASPSPEQWASWLDEVAPAAAVTSVGEVEDLLRESIRGIWLTGMILGGLAALVMALLAIGIYGTVSYRIASTRRDIGIRMALGANGSAVVRSVGAQLARLVALSIAIGTGLAWASDRVLAAGGVPVGDRDPVVLAAVSLVIALAATAACAFPVRRALRIDPADSLRAE